MIRRDVLNNSNQTDREKLLHIILESLAREAGKFEPPHPDSMKLYGHLAYYRGLEVGDLVIGNSGEIGWLLNVGPDEYGNTCYEIEVLGTDRVVSWGNEGFQAIADIPKERLYRGAQRQFEDLCIDQMESHDTVSFMHRYAGVTYNANGDATVRVRRRYSEDCYSLIVQDYKRYLDSPQGKGELVGDLLALGWGDDKLWNKGVV